MSDGDARPFPGFDIQGHRGARGLAPENTLPAFERALVLGVTTLELDTGSAADGTVVVSHDPRMSAVFCAHPDGRPVTPEEEQRLLLFGMPYDEIARYDCGRRSHPGFPEQVTQPAVKPRLADVFAFAERWAGEHNRPLPFYNVETKSWPHGDGVLHPPPEAFVAALWDVVERAGVAERFTLQSFDVRTLQEARQRALPIRLALLIDDLGQPPGDALADGLDALGFVPEIYSPHRRLVTPEVVEAAHRRGLAVLPWTVNEPEEMHRIHDWGADGLITDYPDRAVALFGGVQASR